MVKKCRRKWTRQRSITRPRSAPATDWVHSTRPLWHTICNLQSHQHLMEKAKASPAPCAGTRPTGLSATVASLEERGRQLRADAAALSARLDELVEQCRWEWGCCSSGAAAVLRAAAAAAAVSGSGAAAVWLGLGCRAQRVGLARSHTAGNACAAQCAAPLLSLAPQPLPPLPHCPQAAAHRD